jgi:hypothetical protein
MRAQRVAVGVDAVEHDRETGNTMPGGVNFLSART